MVLSRNMEHLGISLTKYIKDLYNDMILSNYFVKSNKLILKFIRPLKGARILKTTFFKKVKLEDLCSDFQT